MPYTKGFESEGELRRHYLKHVVKQREFRVGSMADYAALADEFLGAPLDALTQECTRATDKDLLRYRSTTSEYGALKKNGYIRTYFVLALHMHRHRTNLEYFNTDCAGL